MYDPLLSWGAGGWGTEGKKEKATFSLFIDSIASSIFPPTHSQFASSTAASHKSLPQMVALERGVVRREEK